MWIMVYGNIKTNHPIMPREGIVISGKSSDYKNIFYRTKRQVNEACGYLCETQVWLLKHICVVVYRFAVVEMVGVRLI